jgi:hypothetical protein
MENNGGRRFLMTMGANLVNGALLALGYIDGAVYRDMFIASTAVYIASNTYQKVKEVSSAEVAP